MAGVGDRIHDRSLFDVEGVEAMPKVRDMTIGPVSVSDVREFGRRYHYTGGEGNAAWRWGLWNGVTLHGVVAYNLPTRKAQAQVFGDPHLTHVWHMGRLILSEESPRNSESRLIGGSLQAIERERPEVWAVLTFAAVSEGHIGYVYQATNALYTGLGGDNNVVHYEDQNGLRRSSNGVNQSAARERGWTTHRDDGGKHRYLYILGNRTQRRQRRRLLELPILPYPKMEA